MIPRRFTRKSARMVTWSEGMRSCCHIYFSLFPFIRISTCGMETFLNGLPEEKYSHRRGLHIFGGGVSWPASAGAVEGLSIARSCRRHRWRHKLPRIDYR